MVVGGAEDVTEFWDERLTSTPTTAASSSALTVPRTTLTSGSSFIDRAYDDLRRRR